MADDFKPVFVNDLKSPEGRLSYPHFDKPDMVGKFPSKKFKGTLIVPKDVDIGVLKKAVLACAKETWPEMKSLKEFQHPFKDGDAKDDEHTKGCITFVAKSKNRPLLVGLDRNNLDPADCYGGCYGRFALTAMSYLSSDNVKQLDGSVKTEITKGVSFLLDGFQKTKDDDPFGNRLTAAAFDDGEFEAVDPEMAVVPEDDGGEEVDDLFG